jgi:hypothetical protein
VGIHREDNLDNRSNTKKGFFSKLLREGEGLGLNSGQYMEKSETERKGKISVA